MLLHLVMTQQLIILISNASVQKYGNSGLAWVIDHDATPIWSGMGMVPGPAGEDMYSGQAEAFRILAATIFLQYYRACYNPMIPDTLVLTFATIREDHYHHDSAN